MKSACLFEKSKKNKIKTEKTDLKNTFSVGGKVGKTPAYKLALWLIFPIIIKDGEKRCVLFAT